VRPASGSITLSRRDPGQEYILAVTKGTAMVGPPPRPAAAARTVDRGVGAFGLRAPTAPLSCITSSAMVRMRFPSRRRRATTERTMTTPSVHPATAAALAALSFLVPAVTS